MCIFFCGAWSLYNPAEVKYTHVLNVPIIHGNKQFVWYVLQLNDTIRVICFTDVYVVHIFLVSVMCDVGNFTRWRMSDIKIIRGFPFCMTSPGVWCQWMKVTGWNTRWEQPVTYIVQVLKHRCCWNSQRFNGRAEVAGFHRHNGTYGISEFIQVWCQWMRRVWTLWCQMMRGGVWCHDIVDVWRQLMRGGWVWRQGTNMTQLFCNVSWWGNGVWKVSGRREGDFHWWVCKCQRSSFVVSLLLATYTIEW